PPLTTSPRPLSSATSDTAASPSCLAPFAMNSYSATSPCRSPTHKTTITLPTLPTPCRPPNLSHTASEKPSSPSKRPPPLKIIPSAIKRRIPSVSVSTDCALDRALELWFCAPDDFSQFVPALHSF